jgi:predicted RNase H-like HicB family nuclease
LTDIVISYILIEEEIMDHIKIVVEKHEDGFVAYPIGMKGIIVGEGDTFEEAFSDAKSAAKFHIETFGDEDFIEYAPQEIFVTEAVI